MAQRSELQALLVSLAAPAKVYFQPPSNIEMKYPCIVYQRSDEDVKFADNGRYRSMMRYQVTVIDEDPDSVIPDRIAALPLCSRTRFFVADNLNHDVFDMFF